MKKNSQISNPGEKLFLGKSFAAFLLLLFAALLLLMGFLIRRPDQQTQNPVVLQKHNVVIDNTTWLLATDHIRKHESFSQYAYNEKDKWYIGYGHQITAGEYFHEPLQLEHAEEMLKNDLFFYISDASERYRLFADQALAVGMIAYNIGSARVNNGRIGNLLRMYALDKNVYTQPQWRKQLSDCWSSYNKFNGKPHHKLTQRRAFELTLFFNVPVKSPPSGDSCEAAGGGLLIVN